MIINVLDEQQRYVRFKPNHYNVKQITSHTYSYLYMRQQLKEVGHCMGFDNLEKLIMYQLSRGVEEARD